MVQHEMLRVKSNVRSAPLTLGPKLGQQSFNKPCQGFERSV